MKKYLSIIMTLVLTTALFTGCGCTSQDAVYTTAPTTMPTIMTTPTTEATRETTNATTEPTIDRGNGPLETTQESTAVDTQTTESTGEARTRQANPFNK